MDHNILIVSEKDQKAYLPYKCDEVEEILNSSNNQYQSIEDVVSDLYVLPLNQFKNSAISRFRETLNS